LVRDSARDEGRVAARHRADSRFDLSFEPERDSCAARVARHVALAPAARFAGARDARARRSARLLAASRVSRPDALEVPRDPSLLEGSRLALVRAAASIQRLA